MIKISNDKVRTLLCENNILEQLMSIPISEIISYSRKWGSVDPEEALCYLAEMYIDNCGVSIGLRSFADYCSVFWIDRLKHAADKNFGLMYGDSEHLFELLPFLSDKYTKEIDKYDISFMTAVELRDILVDELESAPDEKIKIILCAGVCNILPQISNDCWLESYEIAQIEDAIVNFKEEKLMRYRYNKDIAKYRPRFRYSTTKNGTEQILDKPPYPFTEEEIHHFELLNKRLVELQREVMEQVREITLNLQDQIAKGFHQYNTFNVEGIIFIDNWNEDIDSLLNILADNARYTVMVTNDKSNREDVDRFIALGNINDNNWYGNWQGIFRQLESEHGLRVCRAFCKMFEEAEVFTIADIMKLKPEMLSSQVKIYI